MITQADKTQDNNSRSTADRVVENQTSNESTLQFVNMRPEAIAQRKMQAMADSSPEVVQLMALHETASSSPQVQQVAQLQAITENQQPAEPVQRKENSAGMPAKVAVDSSGQTGIEGFVKGIKEGADPEQAASDIFLTFLNAEYYTQTSGEAASKGTAAVTGDKDAAQFGSAFEGFAAGFNTIKNAYLCVKSALESVNSQENADTPDKAQKARKATVVAFEAAKSAVQSIKAFYDLVQGSASATLVAIVPGADIAVSAIKLTMQGYYAIQSQQNANAMSEQLSKTEAAAKKPDDKNSIDEAAEFFRKNRAMIANKRALIAEDEEEIRKIDADPKADKDALKRKDKRLLRIKQLKDDIQVIDKQKFKDGKITREDVAEYTLNRELRDINTKRVTRQGVHIVTEMTKIAGSIAILSGVGAVAGGAIKGATVAVDLALPGVRKAKQAGRNSAARDEAKNKVGDSSWTMFDTSKSDAAKKDFRLQQVRTLLSMAKATGAKKPEDARKDYEKLTLYLSATGVDLEALFKDNGKPDKQIKRLFNAIIEREFF
ncbi:MAG: hypothetical protein KKA07_08360 [Bacteroidetes bacterium]|nr:hypothetical protein [Bacteroidota bacterium]MBU1719073.1 hypothetical protein [Bacteroidota bacterium]